ncbi:MAG TPA: PAS domain S-box protein [Stellaceae bacterium]|nr:PAS domain S-box protein [Stellaceae bacterium]
MASNSEPSPDALAEILEAIGDAVYAMDRDERILYANRRALELWGKTAGEVIGEHLLDVFPGIADGEPYRAYRAVLESREPAHLETIAPALGGLWIGLDVHPAPHDGLVVVFRDIDDRKRAEAALRDSEERFRSMLEALPQMAFVIRPDGEALYYNKQFRDYAGEPIGPALADRNSLLDPEDQPKLMAARRAAAAAGVEYQVEARMRRHDGVYRWHRIQNRPMHSDGRVAYWLGTAVDIDDIRHANEILEQRVAARTAELEAANRRLAAQIEEREAAEAQLRHAQRIEAIGQLTAGIAHDFNNLLTSIVGNIELLEARLGHDVDERSARLLRAALAAGERGAGLTAQLLAFSRQQRMHPEPLDLNRVIGGMSALLTSTIGGTIRIEMQPAAELWPALADAAQIELVLLNLAINSRDAMPEGGTIAVSTRNVTTGPPQRPEEPAAGDYVAVAVADTGAGIPAEIRDKVFDPFFTTKEIGRGSGLGLSQVLGVAHQLGGGVHIETELRVGTTVTVYLPRADVAAGGAVRRGRAERRHAAGGTAASGILLVDDDDDVRAVAAAMLREAGHTVIEAGSGGAALERLDREAARIDLLIADLAMPGMNGFELARAARQERPDLPILFVTGFADMAKAGDSAQETVLQKPFRAEELNAKVAEVLG